MGIKFIKPKIIDIFFMIKIFADMFYQFKWIDIGLALLTCFLLAYAIIHKKLVLIFIDYLIISLFLLFTISYFKDLTYLNDYIKIASSFVLYFIGRYFYIDEYRIAGSLRIALLCALVINVVYCIIGSGTIIWGNALTYRGMYFFKTDFALSLSTFLIFWLIKENRLKKIDYFPLIVAVILIILCNARIFYIITALLLYFIWFYNRNITYKLISKRNILLCILISLFCVALMGMLSNLSFFAERNMLGLKFSSISDLFNTSNTQGRSIIWAKLLGHFHQKSLLTRLMGSSLAFNDLYGLSGFNEHSLYIKLIINTGYIGFVIGSIFTINVFMIVLREKDKRSCYIAFSLIAIYLIMGVTVPTILYTSSSWLPMFFCGTMASKDAKSASYNRAQV